MSSAKLNSAGVKRDAVIKDSNMDAKEKFIDQEDKFSSGLGKENTLTMRSSQETDVSSEKETKISNEDQNVSIDIEGIRNTSEHDLDNQSKEKEEFEHSVEETKLITSMSPRISNIKEADISFCKNIRASWICRFCESCQKCFWSYIKALSINGEERVRHEFLEEEDFELDSEIKVANYDEKFLKTHWNSAMIKQSLGRRLKASLKNGLIQRTFPIESIFLFTYYLVSIIILSQICCEDGNCGFLDKSTKEMMTRRFAISKSHVDGIESDNVTYFCNNYEDLSAAWNEKEHRLTRVLTFLVGFYVAFVVRTWWQQARLFPTTDKASLGMGSFIWVDSGIDESQVNVKVGRKIVTLMQLKKDIMRLLLLSYAMCFCRISVRLKSKLPRAQDFIDKRLLTEKEYKLLKTKTKDGWLIKWATPQLWVNRLACNVENKKSLQYLNPNIKNVDKYVKIKEPKEIGIALFKFKDDLQRLSNTYNFRIPSMMRQVILIALYFYIMLGAVAGQGNIFHLDNKMSLIQKLVSNFPLYYCVKHLLIIGWLKTATDLQNPFGEDE